ncbi:MAG TPA: beta-eliminating lyase-related protein, partial [Puia sp.]
MRQAGYMAAAGVYALENHLDRLVQDHEHARQIAAALEKKGFVKSIMPVETNIIIFEVEGGTCAKDLAQHLKEKGILAIAISTNQIRFVTHLDISPEMVGKVVDVISAL